MKCETGTRFYLGKRVCLTLRKEGGVWKWYVTKAGELEPFVPPQGFKWQVNSFLFEELQINLLYFFMNGILIEVLLINLIMNVFRIFSYCKHRRYSPIGKRPLFEVSTQVYMNGETVIIEPCGDEKPTEKPISQKITITINGTEKVRIYIISDVEYGAQLNINTNLDGRPHSLTFAT